MSAERMSDDRTVHAWKPGFELVRYDRAGAWYVEATEPARLIPARRVTIREAVDWAMRAWHHEGGSVEFGRHGGGRFDFLIRRAVQERQADRVY